MQKTLGGDRLGSGKKMKVELHNYERSTHDLGYLWRSTMAAGTLVPFMNEIALPGDTFDINLNCDIKTHPTIGPLFGSYKVQLDVFMTPIRLYNSKLHNNALGIGRQMSLVKLPQLQLIALGLNGIPPALDDIDNMQINPSSLPAYLGIRGIGVNQDAAQHERNFNAIPTLIYYDIYKNYYANKQEEFGMVVHTEAVALIETVDNIDFLLPDNSTLGTLSQAPATSPMELHTGYKITIDWTGTQPLPNQILLNTVEKGEVALQDLYISYSNTGTTISGYYNSLLWGSTLTVKNWRYRSQSDITTGKPELQSFLLKNIDDMREAILAADGTVPFIINIDTILTPYTWLSQTAGDTAAILNSQEGLAIKTYQSDLFNNWLKTENIDAITSTTAIDTTGGFFTIDQLNLSRKVYNMLNRINVSGGSYDDWLDAVWANERYQKCETPMYMGGLIKELVFQEVISNSESPSGQPLGTLAGKGIMAQKHKGGTIICKVDEPSYIMGIISLTPRVDYSQGNKWDTHLQTMDDFHKPALDEIGFQELITEQMAWFDTEWLTGTWTTKSAGKQPAWINYMTNVNQVRGNFAIASNEMFMTLNRRYEHHPTTLQINDLTTYIDPAKFNFIFAETNLDAQNFWAQISVDITARRKMSAKIMPNL